MDEGRFICVTCGSEFAKEIAADVCDLCHHRDCNECITDDGNCIPCDGNRA